MQLVDIGANLTHESFQHDFDRVLEQAQFAGVSHIILTGTDLATSEAAQRLAEQRPALLSSTVGFHPHVASQTKTDELSRAEDLLSHPSVVAIGETGLDYHRNYSSPQDQRRVFERHLELAAARRMPLFLHQRESHSDFFAMLSAYRPDLVGGVVHCFTDSEQALQDYLELDMYIGITGWVCDERRGQDLQRLVRLIPDQRLLIETDAPYLLPRTLNPRPKTRRNEPKYLPAVLDQIAFCRAQPVPELARLTAANACRLFGLTLPVQDSSMKASSSS